jgi:hypothetical protein
LHNCRPHRLDCGGCARARATFSSYGHAPYYKRLKRDAAASVYDTLFRGRLRFQFVDKSDVVTPSFESVYILQTDIKACLKYNWALEFYCVDGVPRSGYSARMQFYVLLVTGLQPDDEMSIQTFINLDRFNEVFRSTL